MPGHGTPPRPKSSLENVAEAARVLNVDSAVLAAPLLGVLNSQRNNLLQDTTPAPRGEVVSHDVSGNEQSGESMPTLSAQDELPSLPLQATSFNGAANDLFDDSWQNTDDFDWGLHDALLNLNVPPLPDPFPVGFEWGNPPEGDFGFILNHPSLPSTQEQSTDMPTNSFLPAPIDNTKQPSPVLNAIEMDATLNSSGSQEMPDIPPDFTSQFQSSNNDSGQSAPIPGHVISPVREVRSDPPLTKRPSTTDHRSVGARYPRLAPRVLPPAIIASIDQGHSQVTETALVQRKPRSAYTEAARRETKLTREKKSCVRCRTQRIRCIPGENEDDPCVRCQASNPRMSRLPCLRYKISDSVLYRTGLGNCTFCKNHPMCGKNYGDFAIQSTRVWVGDRTSVLEITQDIGAICRLEVREFVAPDEIDALDLKGRPMWAIPWAIADADKATKAVNDFLDQCVGPYLDFYLDDSDPIVWDVFHSALRKSLFPEPIDLLQDVLRLWVACRFLEGNWRCCGNDNLGAEEVKNPLRGSDWTSPPLYIDYQLASIIIQRILGPLRHQTLKKLQKLVEANKPSNWYTIFLVTFIILHNYEMGVVFQRQFSIKRKASLLYLDMSLIRGIHSGAKTILAHFHSVCKGQLPFAVDFDWDSPSSRKMAALDTEQMEIILRLREVIHSQGEYMTHVSRTDDYDKRFWFISQLFEANWEPRSTYEYSPPAP